MSTNSAADRRWLLCEFNTKSPPARCTQRMQFRCEACSTRSFESSKNVDSVLSASFIEIVGRKLSWKQRKQQLRGWRRELERCRRSGCGYFSDLGYRSRNKTPSKAVPRKKLSMRWTMDDRLVRNTSSVILSKTWNLNKPLQREAVVFTIQTAAGHSLKRNATVGGRYHSYKTTWRRRNFIQRQSQSTVMAQENIAAELMNVEHPTGKTTSEILMRKQSIQSRSIWSKGWRFRATPRLSCLFLLEQRTTTSPCW